MRLMIVVLLGVLVIGCSAAPSPAGPGSPGAPGTPAGGEPTNPDDPLGFGREANTAVVTIGDQRYEFGNLCCVTIGGAIGAVSTGGDPRVGIDLPPMDWQTSGDDWDPPSVEVNSDEGSWSANPEDTALPNIGPGLSQVDSFSSDGFRATGTATFMDVRGWQRVGMGLADEPPDPITGTFEVACPER